MNSKMSQRGSKKQNAIQKRLKKNTKSCIHVNLFNIFLSFFSSFPLFLYKDNEKKMQKINRNKENNEMVMKIWDVIGLHLKMMANDEMMLAFTKICDEEPEKVFTVFLSTKNNRVKSRFHQLFNQLFNQFFHKLFHQLFICFHYILLYFTNDFSS